VHDDSITAATQRFYDTIARRNPDVAFLNYGFADLDAGADEMAPAEIAAASRRLYDAVLSSFTGADRLLEVGCGRGAGAAFVLGSRPVGAYVGLDLSPEHARMTRARVAVYPDSHAAVADARRLPIASASVDAVFSVEAAQHFEERPQFYREVARCLRPGGRFYMASIWRRVDVDTPDVFAGCGLDIVEHEDITANVVRSLARSSNLRREIVQSLQLPERYTPLLMSWAGVRGFEAFEGLAAGVLAYERFVLSRRD
jgi:cyclopropane fatty-acyl-phospholipid synthase-like methyltransferase